MPQPAVPQPGELARMPLFRALPPSRIEEIQLHLHATSFPSGTNILTVEQPGEVAYIIRSGAVKVHVEQREGSDVILAILGPGEVLGEMSVVDRLSRSANVVTMEPAILLWIERAILWHLLETTPTLARNLIEILSRRLRQTNAQVQALATLDVYGRIARQLLVFAETYGERNPDGSVTIPFRLSQSDLAGLTGASRVRVNQVFVDFKQRILIDVDRRYRITLHNQSALAEYIV